MRHLVCSLVWVFTMVAFGGARAQGGLDTATDSPARVEPTDRVRIVAPLAGMAEREEAFDVVIDGPAGARVIVTVDDRVPVELVLDSAGRAVLPKVSYGFGLPDVTLKAELHRDGAVASRSIVTVWRHPSVVHLPDPNRPLRRGDPLIDPGLYAVATGFASVIGGALVIVMTGSEAGIPILVAANGISVALGSWTALMTYAGPVASEPWAAFLGSGLVAAAGGALGLMYLEDGDTIGAGVMLAGSALVAPIGALFGVVVEASWSRGPMMKVGVEF